MGITKWAGGVLSVKVILKNGELVDIPCCVSHMTTFRDKEFKNVITSDSVYDILEEAFFERPRRVEVEASLTEHWDVKIILWFFGSEEQYIYSVIVNSTEYKRLTEK